MTRVLNCILLLCLSISLHAQTNSDQRIIVLGVSQDGGYPHMGCSKPCCIMAWNNDSMRRYVVSLALVDPVSRKWWLFEATPDIKMQVNYFQALTHGQYNFLPDGIFITHAHIGHYTGLMELGKEVMGTQNVPVYVLPRMKEFLETNGPWSQLVKYHNINITALTADSLIQLTQSISVTAFKVPHRDEYSETAGFKIITNRKKYLFIPDINKWDVWDRSIVKEVESVDIALVDATFSDNTELPERNFRSVPHPFVSETIKLFETQSKEMKSKIWFIHFNHTNPLLWSPAKQKEVNNLGFNFARQGMAL